MPLCTTADVKLAARIDVDISEHDAEIPHLIADATARIEHECNVPRGWFDQTPVPSGTAVARRCCVEICALKIDNPAFDEDVLLRRLWAIKHPGYMPALPITDPATLYILPDYVAAGYVAEAA